MNFFNQQTHNFTHLLRVKEQLPNETIHEENERENMKKVNEKP